MELPGRENPKNVPIDITAQAFKGKGLIEPVEGMEFSSEIVKQGEIESARERGKLQEGENQATGRD
ncbi:MAG TPA: hypothetical protein V6D47_13880 [Oscillatoriaceae cyanobacterium]